MGILVILDFFVFGYKCRVSAKPELMIAILLFLSTFLFVCYKTIIVFCCLFPVIFLELTLYAWLIFVSHLSADSVRFL